MYNLRVSPVKCGSLGVYVVWYTHLSILILNVIVLFLQKVTFSQIPYHTVIDRSKWQDKVISQYLVLLS